MFVQDDIETAVRMINEVEILRRAVIKIDGRCGDSLYNAVERFKEALANKERFITDFYDIPGFNEELKEALDRAGIALGGGLTPQEKRKFGKALNITPTLQKRHEKSEESKRFERMFSE